VSIGGAAWQLAARCNGFLVAALVLGLVHPEPAVAQAFAVFGLRKNRGLTRGVRPQTRSLHAFWIYRNMTILGS
jgi:hypothetical protein